MRRKGDGKGRKESDETEKDGNGGKDGKGLGKGGKGREERMGNEKRRKE